MLNFPKTGSTFARKVIKEIYKNKQLKMNQDKRADSNKIFIKELFLPNLRVKGCDYKVDHHGIYAQIPEQHLNKDVYSIVRNPYSRFISMFEFREWVKNPQIPNELFKELYSNHQNMDIDDYIDLVKLSIKYRLGFEIPHVHIGIQSVQFIQTFFKSPLKILSRITDKYIDSNDIFEDLANINFLRQENLRNDLKVTLKKYGFSSAELNVIDITKDSNVTPNKSTNRNKFRTNKFLNYIEHYERLIFRILKNKNIYY